MASVCKSCNNNISNSDFVNCAGVCGEFFHIKCVSVTKPMLSALSNCPNMHWFCYGCNDGNRSISSVINGINEPIERLSSSLTGSLLQFLNGFQILLEKHFESSRAVNIVQSKDNALPSRPKVNDCKVKGKSARRKEKELDADSNSKCSDGPKFHVTHEDSHVKSMVISNIGKGISTDFLVNYLANELKIDKTKIQVSLLLPAVKTVNDLNYLQFKVSVPEVTYSSVMDSNMWPSNVHIRDFVNKPRMDVGVSLDHFIDKQTVKF